MARDTRKELLKQDEFMDTAFDIGHWFEENWKLVARVAVGIVIVAVAIAGFVTMRAIGVRKSQEIVAEGSGHYTRAAASQFIDSDALADALVKFEEAEAKAGSNDPGPLATYYRALTLYRLGRSDEAITALKSFQNSPADADTLRWAATSLLAKLLTESGDRDGAIALLQPIASDDASAMPRDQALLQLGEVYMSAGDATAAREQWQRLVDDLPQSAAASLAQQRLEAISEG